jgi:hypothetical protein
VPNLISFEECKVIKWSRRSSLEVDEHARHTRYLNFEFGYAMGNFVVDVFYFSWILFDTMKPNVNVSYFLSNYELLMIFYKIWSNLG